MGTRHSQRADDTAHAAAQPKVLPIPLHAQSERLGERVNPFFIACCDGVRQPTNLGYIHRHAP